MSKYHSTISRRDFMKGLGLAGAGLGAAAAVSPVFHDLDELTSSSKTNPYHRWWIKERDYEDITTPVDWTVFKAYDPSTHPATPNEFGPGGPVLAAERVYRQSQGAIYKWPGSTIRDLALNSATGGNYGRSSWDGAGGKGPERYEADGQVAVPWEGTPEDNLQTCRAALHFYGSPRVGAIEVNEHVKRLFNVNNVWEDIDEGYRDEDKVYHIPNKCRWLLVWFTKQNCNMNLYILRNDPDDPWCGKVFRQGKAGENKAYDDAPYIRYYAMRFVKSLGYKTYKPNASSNIQHGVWAGLSEMGRAAMTISPDYGMMIRYVDFFATDFPLAPTKPIDAGIREFCKACMRCAHMCPTGAQSLEKEPFWETRFTNNNEGLNTWYIDWDKCVRFGGPWDCITCQSVCPFNHPEKAIIHPLVRAVVGTTSMFNGFFATMDETCGYGKYKTAQEHTDWWYRDLNNSPTDTLLGFGSKEAW